jgi:hypothetical protein
VSTGRIVKRNGICLHQFELMMTNLFGEVGNVQKGENYGMTVIMSRKK